MTPLGALGIDGRVLAGLVGMTLAAVGVGYVVAAGLDDSAGRVAAIAAPRPTLSPEALDDGPLVTATGLPPVVAPTPVPQAPPATPAEPPAKPAPATTALVPTAPAPPSSDTTTQPDPTTTARPPRSTEPEAGPGRPRQPIAENGTSTPFRPAAATAPLEQFLVPAGELVEDPAPP